MPSITAPDVGYPLESGTDYRPSYRRAATYLNEEHAGIFAATKDLPGWQDPPDSEKLYELAYHSGEVILEIGTFGGRSATVELRGALRAAGDRPGRRTPCQFYGVDVDPNSIARTRQTLVDQGLSGHALLYHGNLAAFHRDLPITPTMVFVDGDHSYAGVRADLELLATFLAAGTPVQCHDYVGIPEIKRAVDEQAAGGHYEAMGVFSGSVLLRTTDRCSGAPRGLRPGTFAATREALSTRYRQSHGSGDARAMSEPATPVEAETAAARAELARRPPAVASGFADLVRRLFGREQVGGHSGGR
jgi:predicted O-methyltransferase YrrM